MTTTIDTTADRAVTAQHRAIWALGERFYRDTDTTVMEWEYLIVTLRKRR